MEFTQERVDTFVGGEVEIRSTEGGYLYRGPIIAIRLKDNKLHVQLKYLAIREGGILNPKDVWFKSAKDYNCVIDLSFGVKDEIDRISFLSSSGEVTTLGLPSENKLDSVCVRGLQKNSEVI